jgi:hypothetical protein
MPASYLRSRTAPIILMTLLSPACSTGEDDNPFDPLQFQQRTGVIFVAQNIVPSTVMEALFEGRVIADSAGCLRFDSPDPATVVWPKGFSIAESGSTMTVRNGAGRQIGRIGGTFRLGGGEVASVQQGISPDDRERLETSCPGRYWIVGDVP